MRYRELIEIIGKSRAWARLLNVPAIKQGLAQLQELLKTNEAAVTAQKIFETPENQELLAMLADMVSDEVFSIGSEGYSDAAQLYLRLNTAINYGPYLLILQGKVKPDETGKALMRAVADVLVENNKLIKFPDTVIGFHLTDKKRAESQLKRLDDALNALLFAVPALQGRYKKVQIGDSSFLSLNLDGTMIPWKDLPWEQSGLEEEQIQKLIKILTDLKLTINLGIQGDYLLLNIGGSTKLLERLGGKGESLADRPELKPLQKHLDRKLTSLSYSSRSFRQSSLPTDDYYEIIKELVNALVERADLNAGEKKKLGKEIIDQIQASKQSLPQMGADFSYTFLTSQGQESFDYDYSNYPGQAVPKPLALLDHLGGSPVLAAVFRVDANLEAYKRRSMEIEAIWTPLNKLIEAALPAEVKPKYVEVVKVALPLLKRLDTITRTSFYPALAEGETAFVLDAKLTGNQWHKVLPKSRAALPMLEIGLVLGVSDPDLFVKALGEYKKLLEDAVAEVRKQAPMAEIPEFKFPTPREVKKGGATFYAYLLPEEVGLDKRLMPVIAVGKSVAAFTLSQEHAERLLQKKPLQTRGTAFADPNKPLLSATVFDWPALLDAALPWIEFGVGQSFADEVAKPRFKEEGFKKPDGFKGKEDGPKGPKEEKPKGKKEPPPERTREVPQEHPLVKEVMSQVKMVVEVLKVWKGTTTASYAEEGRVVTHSVTIIRDLEK